MRSNRLLRRASAWIAIFAILAAALSPSISHALASAPDFGQICSVDGPRGGAPASPDETPDRIALEHCPYCASGAGSFAILPAAPAAIFLDARPAIAAARTFPALKRRPPYSSAQPRAPPSFS